MLAKHTVFELRSGRDNERTAAFAAQLFTNLPQLSKHWWDKVLRGHEQISFEILSLNQMVYFVCCVPDRVKSYVRSLLQSSYPSAMITELAADPLEYFAPNAYDKTILPGLACGQMTLTSTQGSLKTYGGLGDLDSLSPLLSTMSAAQPQDMIACQLIVRNQGRSQPSLISQFSNTAATQATSTTDEKAKLPPDSHPAHTLRTQLNIAVISDSQDRAHLWLDSLAGLYESGTHTPEKSLKLHQPFLVNIIPQARERFVTGMVHRDFSWWPRMHATPDELATLYHLPHKGLQDIPNLAWGKHLFSEPPEELPIITKLSPPEIKKDVNVFAQTMFKNNIVTYGVKRTDRRRHMYVIGKTGTGKSTMLANMAINDLKNDEGLCVIDPHGDLVETLLDYIPARRINDVVYFDPADPERTVKINLFEGESVVHRELIASGIVSIFQKLYSYSWGPRLEYILRNALLTLLTAPEARLSDILDLLTNPKFRAQIVDGLEDPILRNFWLFEFDKMQDRIRTEAIAPILNKVGQFVSSPLVRDVVNAHRSSFSIEQIMNEGKILLVNLSQGKLGEDNATLLGAMLITKIQLAAMARVHIPEEERRDFFLYVDEFQNFATSSFNKILSEARKYRLNLTLANQYVAQIPEEVQAAIFGNCGNIASFVMGPTDAEAFTKEYSSKYTVDDLVSLGRYQVVNKLSIDNVVSLPFTGTTLPLAKSINQNRDKVIRVSRERWATKKKAD